MSEHLWYTADPTHDHRSPSLPVVATSQSLHTLANARRGISCSRATALILALAASSAFAAASASPPAGKGFNEGAAILPLALPFGLAPAYAASLFMAPGSWVSQTCECSRDECLLLRVRERDRLAVLVRGVWIVDPDRCRGVIGDSDLETCRDPDLDFGTHRDGERDRDCRRVDFPCAARRRPAGRKRTPIVRVRTRTVWPPSFEVNASDSFRNHLRVAFP